MRIAPMLVGANIVLLGDFNPMLFQPAWFGAIGLLPEGAATSGKVEVVDPEITQFSADWLRLLVTRERFDALTAQQPFTRLRDVVHSVFHEYLTHTPLRELRINFIVHFIVDSPGMRSRIGAALAPPKRWGPWRRHLDLDGPYGGMTILEMSQLRPKGRAQGGQIRIRVQPSTVVGVHRGTGVHVRVDDHFQGDGTADQLLATLKQEFDVSLKRGEEIVDHIMSLAYQVQE